MAKVIDKKINKEITKGLEVNGLVSFSSNSYDLPNFEKNEAGEYIFTGTTPVSSLSQYTNYIETYSEISDFIKSKYAPVIGKIYKNALNSLIAINEQYYLQRNRYSPLSKLDKPFTALQIADELPSNYEEVLSYITRAAYGVQNLKPSVEVYEILRNAQKDLAQEDTIYVLPEIGDYGVVLTPKKGNGDLLEARYEVLSELDAKAIENFMFETASSLDRETAKMVKNQISFIFTLSKKIGDQIMVGSKNAVAKHHVVDDLAELTKSLIELVGADLSAFEKNSNLKNPESYTENIKDSASEQLDHYVDSEAVADAVPNSVNFAASEILIRGTYKTSPAIVGDVIVTKITPEGVKFDVTFENEKLFVQQSQKPTAKQDETPEMKSL